MKWGLNQCFAFKQKYVFPISYFLFKIKLPIDRKCNSLNICCSSLRSNCLNKVTLYVARQGEQMLISRSGFSTRIYFKMRNSCCHILLCLSSLRWEEIICWTHPCAKFWLDLTLKHWLGLCTSEILCFRTVPHTQLQLL